jgi:hypothetical protein
MAPPNARTNRRRSARDQQNQNDAFANANAFAHINVDGVGGNVGEDGVDASDGGGRNDKEEDDFF